MPNIQNIKYTCKQIGCMQWSKLPFLSAVSRSCKHYGLNRRFILTLENLLYARYTSCCKCVLLFQNTNYFAQFKCGNNGVTYWCTVQNTKNVLFCLKTLKITSKIPDIPTLKFVQQPNLWVEWFSPYMPPPNLPCRNLLTVLYLISYRPTAHLNWEVVWLNSYD